ncbi:FAD-binding oxidoreductase [Oceanisphaera arctica]|uniref:FAD-linked oxidase n=1 Tax=Oceanisphaera arctica TaxID=641510 RepID=A0A2P5TR07_9GAMM|nr:FAD-binding oxidoreductase [Oceanisphaera arctica]PPL18175.1 FAD-linked oxidase [Oceanisphaera arctica]GHA21935.1 FAD-linked oxidase [Oceanisphaera arctica]
MTSFSQNTINALKEAVTGSVVLPEDAGYNEVRKIWNATIDRHPAVIVQCAEAADVPRALHFARQQGLEVSVRGAGHNIAGNAVCEGGIMIDLSNMTRVLVDAAKKIAYVEPGARLGDVDKATQQHGLATPLGINSTTGTAGLTLGGGFGWLTRQYGMTVDNLLAVDLVTADGRELRASEQENEDLFWAIRGAGGNFGIVTGFEYRLHPVGPEITAGLIVFPIAQAKRVLQQYRDYMDTAPEALNIWVVMRKAPPLPFLPEEVHGKEVAVLAVFYAGDPAEAECLIAPLRDFGTPYGEHVGVQPYVEWQQAFDPLLTPGARNYWKSHNFTALNDEALDTMIDFTHSLPGPQCEIFIGMIGGAANRVAANAMAYGHRDARFVLNVHARWDETVQDKTCIAWAREFFKASAPYASAGVYINFMTEEEGDRVKAAYGLNYDRLVQLKRQYDPDNLFHLNQNIRP